MVEFLDFKTPDFMLPCCLVLKYNKHLSSLNKIKFAIEAGQQLTEPAAKSQFVLTTQYDVSITSRLAKNI